MNRKILLLMGLVGAFASVQPEGASASHFKSIRIGQSKVTVISGLNDSGVMTGSYGTSTLSGFLRTADGTITTFDVAGAADTGGISINNNGVIAGNYAGTSNWQPFVRYADGTITAYDVSGVSNCACTTGINDSGTIVGWYDDSSGFDHGFLITTDGTITTFDVPGAVTTQPSGINAEGYVVGGYSTTSGGHGFIMAPDGNFTSFDDPDGTGVFPMSINDNGDVAGYYYTGSINTIGFVRTADGTFKTIDCPDSGTECKVMSINNAQQIAGSSYTGSQTIGFSQSSDGTTETFHPRSAVAILNPYKINANGWIVGYYSRTLNTAKEVGFLWKP